MKKKKNVSKKQNIKLAFIFCFFVLILIMGSLFLKAGILIKKSNFDGQHRFTISFSKSLINSDIQVVSFAPDTKSISILFVSKNNFSKVQNIEKYLQIPIDASVQFDGLSKIEEKKLEPTIRKLILNFNNTQTNLTIIDLVRLWLFTKNVSSHAVITRAIDFPLDDAMIDKTSSFLFNDYTLTQENQSIQIINGTKASGLGNRLARIISNAGGNIISVSTADDIIKYSEILYFGKKSYTAEKLSKILNFPLSNKQEEKTGEAISDITVIIGKDSAYSF